MAPRISLAELQRIKRWHVAHRAEHPLEYELWDIVLTVWMLGWMGWLPAIALDHVWFLLLCPPAMHFPSLYVHWRQRAHAAQRVRCDWLKP